MTTTPIDSVIFFEDEYILEHNSEYADMSNPTGARYSRALFISATTARGQRFILSGFKVDSDESDRAKRLVDRILAAGAINQEHWFETYSVYGSDHWTEEDMERQFAWDSNPATRGTVRDY
jgi:hypothetical protein